MARATKDSPKSGYFCAFSVRRSKVKVPTTVVLPVAGSSICSLSPAELGELPQYMVPVW